MAVPTPLNSLEVEDIRSDGLIFKVKLIEDEDGMFSCLNEGCRGSIWCSHMEQVMVTNADAQLFFPPDAEPLERRMTAVPVIPTLDQWGTCILHYNANLGAYKVLFENEVIHRKNFHDEAELPFLGFLNRGDGRAALRLMLMEYAKFVTNTVEVKCTSKSHTFSAQMNWERNTTQSEKMKSAELWSVINTGTCITCSNSKGTDDFSDLVPDPGGKKNWL